MKFNDIIIPDYTSKMLKDDLISHITGLLDNAKIDYYDAKGKHKAFLKVQIGLLTQMINDYDYEIVIKQFKKERLENE